MKGREVGKRCGRKGRVDREGSPTHFHSPLQHTNSPAPSYLITSSQRLQFGVFPILISSTRLPVIT